MSDVLHTRELNLASTTKHDLLKKAEHCRQFQPLREGMGGPRGEQGDPDSPLPEKKPQKYRVFSNTGPDPLK